MRKEFHGDLFTCLQWEGYATQYAKSLPENFITTFRPSSDVEITINKPAEYISIRALAKKEDALHSRFLYYITDGSLEFHSLAVTLVDEFGNSQTASIELYYNLMKDLQLSFVTAKFDISKPDDIYILCQRYKTISNINEHYRNADTHTDWSYVLGESHIELYLYKTQLFKNKKGMIYLTAPQFVASAESPYIYNYSKSNCIVWHTGIYDSEPYTWEMDSHTKSCNYSIKDMLVDNGQVSLLYSYTYYQYDFTGQVSIALWGSWTGDTHELYKEGYNSTTGLSLNTSGHDYIYIDKTPTLCYWTETFGYHYSFDINTASCEGLKVPICYINKNKDYLLACSDYRVDSGTYECGMYFALGGTDTKTSGKTSYSHYDFKPKRPFYFATNDGRRVYDIKEDVYKYKYRKDNFEVLISDDDIWGIMNSSPVYPIIRNGNNYSIALNIRFDIDFSYARLSFIFEHFDFASRMSDDPNGLIEKFKDFYVGYPKQDTSKMTKYRGMYLADWLDFGYGGLSWSNPIWYDGFFIFPFVSLLYDKEGKRYHYVMKKVKPNNFWWYPSINNYVVFPTQPFQGTYIQRYYFVDITGAKFMCDSAMIDYDKQKGIWYYNDIPLNRDIKPITIGGK